MLPVTIRLAAEDDAELIADISRYCFYHTYAALNSKENMDKFMNEQFSIDMLKQEVFDDNTAILLAYHQDDIAGYAKLLKSSAHSLLGSQKQMEIARFYALPNFKGKGVGKQLMQTCIAYAEKWHADVLWLGVWEKNENAQAFYRHMGFEKFGTHTFQLGDDLQNDWLMLYRLKNETVNPLTGA